MSDSTYDKPAAGWTCFHCGETFTTVGGARDHFGADPSANPGCIERVRLGAERGLLMALRKLEKELATHHAEDTGLHREMARMRMEHSQNLENAEIAGYERGLRDMNNEWLSLVAEVKTRLMG